MSILESSAGFFSTASSSFIGNNGLVTNKLSWIDGWLTMNFRFLRFTPKVEKLGATSPALSSKALNRDAPLPNLIHIVKIS